MAVEWIIGFVLLTLPLVFAGALVYFMAAGKGKPAATQDRIEEAKATKATNAVDQ
ncbi:MAG: hypothetical protein LAT76_05920 [Schleiferiaceae bacterium]|nr:hypothetical protein [Schleiferiaceae bacterium]